MGNTTPKAGLIFDLGMFEGFNFRNQSAIERSLTAEEVVGWDHGREGEAEFWPAGDNLGVSAVFAVKTSVTASELVALDRLLDHFGDDSADSYLMICDALCLFRKEVVNLTTEQLDHVSWDNSWGPRRDAVCELFAFLQHRRLAQFGSKG